MGRVSVALRAAPRLRAAVSHQDVGGSALGGGPTFGGNAAPSGPPAAWHAGPAMRERIFRRSRRSQPLTPEEQATRFILPPGYRLELVLSEPDIVNPTAIAFDGNGRLYVNEMRSYMLDADGGGQLEPISRISMHESTKGDGTFDRHYGLRRQARAAALRAAARQAQHPDDGDERGRRFQVHRHERRRRGGQEGAVLQRRRPAREPRASAERVRVGARQLDLQHLQRLPLPLDARAGSSGSRPGPTAASGA